MDEDEEISVIDQKARTASKRPRPRTPEEHKTPTPATGQKPVGTPASKRVSAPPRKARTANFEAGSSRRAEIETIGCREDLAAMAKWNREKAETDTHRWENLGTIWMEKKTADEARDREIRELKQLIE